jgi:hypothetical protein
MQATQGAHPSDTGMHLTDGGTTIVDSGPISTDSGMGTPICDGSDDIRFGVMNSGSRLVPVDVHFLQPRGAFLVIDGHCRYFASWNGMNGIATGTLDAEEAAQLASDVRWNDIESLHQYMLFDPNCQDGWGPVITNGQHGFGCVCQCDPAAPPTLKTAADAGNTWIMRLQSEGTLLNGAVTAGARPFVSTTPPPSDPQFWPLPLRPIADLTTADGSLGSKRFDDPNDTTALRKMRAAALASSPDAQQIYATYGSQVYLLYVRDEFDDDMEIKINLFQTDASSSH